MAAMRTAPISTTATASIRPPSGSRVSTPEVRVAIEIEVSPVRVVASDAVDEVATGGADRPRASTR